MNTNLKHHAEQNPCILPSMGLTVKYTTAEPTAANVPEQQQRTVINNPTWQANDEILRT